MFVNLSPSEQRKNGPLFDLAIAIAALKELYVIQREIPIDVAFIGALSLDGAVVKAEGMLPALISAKRHGIKKVYLPYDPTIPLHMLKEDFECVVVQHIEEVVQHIGGQELLSILPSISNDQTPLFSDLPQKDFYHVIGHD